MQPQPYVALLAFRLEEKLKSRVGDLVKEKGTHLLLAASNRQILTNTSRQDYNSKTIKLKSIILLD
jgi:hypothetical protein